MGPLINVSNFIQQYHISNTKDTLCDWGIFTALIYFFVRWIEGDTRKMASHNPNEVGGATVICERSLSNLANWLRIG